MTAPDRPLFEHASVLADEVGRLLAPALGPGARAVDCTAGGGGHTALLLETGAEVLAIDRDPLALETVRARFEGAPGLRTFHGSFAELDAAIEATFGGGPVQAIFADLGVSSPQLDLAERGFSFNSDGPLDMRMDTSAGPTLAERLEAVDAAELADVLYRFGEERRSRAVARAIVAARDEGRLTGTRALAEVIARVVGRAEKRIHPATRSFQGLRIWVNDELGALERLLEDAPARLAPGGRLGVISFHSLEDRRVKQVFRGLSSGPELPRGLPVAGAGPVAPYELITRKAVQPSEEERERNGRARSARLRVLARREGQA